MSEEIKYCDNKSGKICNNPDGDLCDCVKEGMKKWKKKSKVKTLPLSIFIHDTLELNIDGVKEEFKVVGTVGVYRVTSINLVNTKIPNKNGEIITITLK